MCEAINYDFGDLNLDFLELSYSQPTPEAPQIGECVSTPPEGKKYRIAELAKRITNSDLYVKQIKSLENERQQMQKQLNELKSSADDIRKLYLQENEERKRLQILTDELSTKCESLQKEVDNKTFLYNQLDSQLEDIKNLPIQYNHLAQSYVRLFYKYEEDTKQQLPMMKALLAEKLRTYCKENYLTVPDPIKRSPKKRASKVGKKNSYIQCEIWKNAPMSVPPCLPASKPKELRSQGTQHISTTTTRSTCTSAIVLTRTVGTSFPEQHALPPFNDIIKELRQWDIQPLSPIADVKSLSPVAECEASQTPKTVNKGTCTLICNVQRTVDYIGSVYQPLTSIKRSNSRPPSRTMLESVKHETITPPPSSPAVNSSHLGIMENRPASFDDLWHIFGQMLFGLLRNRQGERVDAGARNVGSAAYTQQELNQWLASACGNAPEQPEQNQMKSNKQKTSDKEHNPVDYMNIVRSPLAILNPSKEIENSPGNTEDCQKSIDVPQQNRGSFSPARSFCSSKDLPNVSLDATENIRKIRLSSECLSENSGFHRPPINEPKNISGLKTKKPKSHPAGNVADETLKLVPKVANGEVIKTKIKKLVKEKSKRKHKNPKKSKACISSEAQDTDLSGKLKHSADSEDVPKKQFIVEKDGKTENGLNSFSYVTTNKFEENLEEPSNIVANEEMLPSSPGKLELPQEIDNLRTFSITPNKEEENLEEAENNKNALNSDRFNAEVEVREVKETENLLNKRVKKRLSVPSTELCETAVDVIMQLGNFTYDADKYNDSITKNEHKTPESSSLHSNQNQCNNSLESSDIRKLAYIHTKNVGNQNKPAKNQNQVKKELMCDLFGSETEDSDADENNLKQIENPSNSNELLRSDHRQAKCIHEPLSAFHQNVLHKTTANTNESFQKIEPINEYSSSQQPEANQLPQFKCVKSVNEEEPVNHLTQINSLQDPNFPGNESSCFVPVTGSQSLQYTFCHQNTASSNSFPICVDNSMDHNDSHGCTFVKPSTPSKELPQELAIENELPQELSPIYQDSWDEKEEPTNIMYQVALEENTQQYSTELCQQYYDENETPENIGELIPYSPSSLYKETATPCKLAEEIKDQKKTNQHITINENNTQYIKNEIKEIPMTFSNSCQPKDSQKEDASFQKPKQIELPNVSKDVVDEMVIEEADANTIGDAETGKSFLTNVLTNAVDEDTKRFFKSDRTSDSNADRTDIATSLNKSIVVPKEAFISSENISNTSSNEIIQEDDEHKLQDVATRSMSPVSSISSLLSTSSVENEPKKRGRKRKSEMSLTPTKISRTANIACKHSERLRAKQEIAKTMAESYIKPTLPSIALRKNTNKEVYSTNESTFQVEKEVVIPDQAVDKDPLSMQINLGYFTERDASELNMKEVHETGNEKESEKVLKAACESKLDETSSLSTDFQDNRQYKSIVEKTDCIVYPQPQMSEEDNQPTTVTDESFPKTIFNSNKSNCDIIPKVERLYPSSPPLSCTQNDSPASPPYQRYDSPASSPPEALTDPSKVYHSPLKVSPGFDTTQKGTKNIGLLEHLITNYQNDIYKLVKDSYSKKNPATKELLSKLCKKMQEFLANTTEATDQIESSAFRLISEMYAITQNLKFITEAVVVVIQQAPRPEVELKCDLADVPQKYLGKQHSRISFVMQRLQMLHPQFLDDLLGQLESKLFNYDTNDKLSLPALLNLTQLYLLTITIQLPHLKVNPARLFVAKCLYYYKLRAIPMIYEVLCCFPTTLPHREERAYDRSDALITVIQHLLMSTKYDMGSKDLCTKQLLSKLRFEYHFEPFKPERAAVLTNLVDKLKAGKVENVPYAMALFCKRMPQPKVEADVLQAELLPLVYEYYRGIVRSDAHDDAIAGLLECISMVIKPFRLDTDIDLYLSIFRRFLNVTDRPRIKEAAVQAILRCQRFGYVDCFNALVDFKPNCDLKPQTKAMLKTFIYRKPAKFLHSLLRMSLF